MGSSFDRSRIHFIEKRKVSKLDEEKCMHLPCAMLTMILLEKKRAEGKASRYRLLRFPSSSRVERQMRARKNRLSVIVRLLELLLILFLRLDELLALLLERLAITT